MLTPKVTIVELTWNSSTTCLAPLLKILLAVAVTMFAQTQIAVMPSFRLKGQFCGLEGSLGPLHVMRLGSSLDVGLSATSCAFPSCDLGFSRSNDPSVEFGLVV